jgi:hypothetical protein
VRAAAPAPRVQGPGRRLPHPPCTRAATPGHRTRCRCRCCCRYAAKAAAYQAKLRDEAFAEKQQLQQHEREKKKELSFNQKVR